MVGIISYGVHIPLFRLKKAEIGRAWGKAVKDGERSVAYYNEDSITMAVNAVKNCLLDIDRTEIDTLYFASTTSPYQEKLSAATIAMASDLNRTVLTGDFTNSLRCGTIAIRAAMDAIHAGSARNVLVVASDSRIGKPGSEFEHIFGDGAAALLIGKENIIATIEGQYTHFDELYDLWRRSEDKFISSWDKQFTYEEGYMKNIEEGFNEILKKHSLKIEDVHKVAYYAPDETSHRLFAKKNNLNYEKQVQDPLFNTIGNTGCAFALMLFILALENSSANELILLGNYGDGIDIFLFKSTSLIAIARKRRGVEYHIQRKAFLNNYEGYLQIRNIIPTEKGRMAVSGIPLPEVWRERYQALSFHGSRCNQCGTVHYPIQRVCAGCLKKDDYQEIRLSDKKGKIFSYTKDYLASTVDPPLYRALVDLEGGGRGHFVVTDVGDKDLYTGMEVEMTFRNEATVDGINRYIWICKPIR